MKAVEDGTIFATIVQKPFEFGYQSMKALKTSKTERPSRRRLTLVCRPSRKDNLVTFWAELREMEK